MSISSANQRMSALRFDDPRVQALLSALLLFVLLPRGFSNRDLRQHIGPLLGLDPGQLTQARGFAARSTSSIALSRGAARMRNSPHEQT